MRLVRRCSPRYRSKILEDFDADLLNVTEEKVLYDFSATDLESIVWSDNKAMNARLATQEEIDDIEETEKNSAENSWKSRFSVSGQKFAYRMASGFSSNTLLSVGTSE